MRATARAGCGVRAGGCGRGCGQERATRAVRDDFADPRLIEHPHGVEELGSGRGGLGGRGRRPGLRAWRRGLAGGACRGLQEGMWAARAVRAGVGGARAEAVDIGRSSHTQAVGTAEWARWPGGALGPRRAGGLTRGGMGVVRRGRKGAAEAIIMRPPRWVRGTMGRGGSILRRVLHPRPLAGPALALRDRESAPCGAAIATPRSG